MLHGRSSERARLAALLADAEAARPGALVLLGEPGVGKSALLEDVQAAAARFLLLRTQGLESESPLAFAALQRLFRPVRGLLPRLPAPQAQALRLAFGLEPGPAVEPFLVALATSSMLTEAAESAPVLCVVDDAHWLDAASRDALLFAARRLADERVAVLLTARSGDGSGFSAPGLDSLTLGGLDDAAAAAVLAERHGRTLPRAVVAALLEQTGGNPLALAELPATLTAQQLSGIEPLPDRLPLTQAVERIFLDRVRRLSEQAQTLLLVASADDTGRLGVVRHAADRLGSGKEALAAAEHAGLIITDADTVRVAHPLVRSATYLAATGSERRAAHHALAAALGELGEIGAVDRRAWHVAASLDGPDADAAHALTHTAVRAERRGGYDAAAAAFQRAAELTPHQQARSRLLFDAARNFWLAGRPAVASTTADAARERADDRILRADIDRLRGRLEVNVGSAATARRLLVDAARDVAVADPQRALEMTVAAMLLSVYDPQARDDSSIVGNVATTDLTPGAGPRAVTLRRMLDALTAVAEGRMTDALASLDAAVSSSAAIAAEQRSADRTVWRTCAASEPDVLANLGNTAMHLGHDVAARDCYLRVLDDGRNNGAITVVLYALPRLAFPELLLGQWDDLRQNAEEAVELADGLGQPALAAGSLAWLALLAALQGDPAYEQRRDRAAHVSSARLGVLAQVVRDLLRWAAATAATTTGDYSGALHHCAAIRVPALRHMTALDRVEAAVRAGERSRASDELDELCRYAGGTGLPWALAAKEHGLALLADPADTTPHFESALAQHRHSGRVFYQARTHLAYGEVLRRSGKRVEARVHLRAALTIFDELHAEPFTARAAQELRASGETARRRDPSTTTTLTPMERQIALLVAQGMSNKDVAAQCWISPRTVAFHLRGVFAKLGVSSRGELALHGLTPRLPTA